MHRYYYFISSIESIIHKNLGSNIRSTIVIKKYAFCELCVLFNLKRTIKDQFFKKGFQKDLKNVPINTISNNPG